MLAEELAAADRLELALARYEGRVKPFVTRQQEAARRFAGWFLPKNRWQLAIREAMMWAAGLPSGAWLLKRELAAPSLFAE